MDEDGPPAEATNLVTGSVSGNVVQAGHIGAVHLGVGPRTRYLEWVRDIAPGTLVGREAELAELAAFCTAGDEGRSYAWWLGEAWTGKSALMSTFVLDPPSGVRVVSFFVTARFGGADDRGSFVDGVLEQLAALLGEAVPVTSSEVHLRGMLAEAAEMCRSRGERLVLVVDGLDEDRGVGAGPAATHSIAALLPARPAAGLRVIVASRPNPPVPADVPDDHPLRDAAICRRLEPSPAAQADRSAMERELDLLLHGTSDERDLVALIIAANGGLSSHDLGELTGRSARETGRKLNSVASRSFTRRPAIWRPETSPEVYLLGHEGLRSEAEAELEGERREDCRRRLFQWAEEYRRRGWPEETPQYLLQGFFRLLSSDPPAMVAFATDPARQERLLDVSGNDIAALTQLTAAQNAGYEEDAPDLVSLIRLAVHRDNLTDRNTRIPVRLPALWAILGRPDHAEALLRSIADPRRHQRAVRSLAGLLSVAGDIDEAEALARSITGPYEAAGPLATLIRRARSAGDANRVRRLADHAESLLRSARGPVPEYAAGAMVEVVAAAGELDRAYAIAETLPEGWSRTRALIHLAREAATGGEGDRALELAEATTDASDRHKMITAVVEGMGAAGDAERAVEIAEALPRSEEPLHALVRVLVAYDPRKAMSVAARIKSPALRARALVAAVDHAPELRRRLLADAIRTDHWERTLPALDQGEMTDLLDVVDELSLLHRSRGLPPTAGR